MRIIKALLMGGGFALMVAALCLIFLHDPTDGVTGIVRKIIYVHVPVSWLAFLAIFVVALGSVLYLWRRSIIWDNLACASAEIGLIFTTAALVTGSIWAKSLWGVWWVWDARLVTTLVLWFIYLAYFIVRYSAVDEARARNLAAVVGIVGLIDVPICALAISLWRTQHPSPLVFEGGLAPAMLTTLLVSLAAFTVLYLLLLSFRVSLGNDEHEVRRLRKAKRF